MADTKKIEEMENILSKHRKSIEDFNKALKEFKDSQEEYNKLSDYYSSQEYMDDLKDCNDGKIDNSISQGIYSEDLVFDLIGDNYHTAVDMLELATKIIKRH